MFSNQEIIKIAMQQSARDINAQYTDFLKETNVIVRSEVGSSARKYYKEPITCNLVSYGNNVVASVRDAYREIIEAYIAKFEFYRCFETPNMHWLDAQMEKMGQKICFMAEYFLPDMDRLSRLSCSYERKELEQKDFSALYVPEWSNALCKDRKELDVLGIGAYENDKLIGLAACSADSAVCGRSESMCCRNIAEKALRLLLQVIWPSKFWKEEKCRFIVVHGPMSDRLGTQ